MRYISCHDIYQKLSHEQLNIMLAVYCVTGCDTVSAFFGHGKKVFCLLMTKANKFQALTTLGMGLLTDVQKEASTKFIAMMYGKPDCHSLNLLRVDMASATMKKSKLPAKKLPPTDNSFLLHILHSVYQLIIW